MIRSSAGATRAITKFLRQRGWSVEYVDFHKQYGAPERNTNGAAIRASKRILLDVYLRKHPRKRMMLLLHEAGHALQYKLKLGTQNTIDWETPRSCRTNEQLAYHMGTALAAHLGIVLDRQAWVDCNWEAF